MKRGNTGRPDLPESPKVARSSSRDSESDSLSTVSTVWLTSCSSSPSQQEDNTAGASPPQGNDTYHSIQAAEPAASSAAATQSPPPNFLDVHTSGSPVDQTANLLPLQYLEYGRARSISMSESNNTQNPVIGSGQHSPQTGAMTAHSGHQSTSAGLNNNRFVRTESGQLERRHRMSPLCFNNSSGVKTGSNSRSNNSSSASYYHQQPGPSISSNNSGSQSLHLEGEKSKDSQTQPDAQARTFPSTDGNKFSFGAGQAVRNFPSGMSSMLGNFARDQVRPLPLSVYESSDGSLFTNISPRSVLPGSSSAKSTSSRIHISRPDGICLLPRRKSYSESTVIRYGPRRKFYSESTVISSLGLEGSSARSRGLPSYSGNSSCYSLVSGTADVNSQPSSQGVNGAGRSFLTTNSMSPGSGRTSGVWRQQPTQGASGNIVAVSSGASTSYIHRGEPSASSHAAFQERPHSSSGHQLSVRPQAGHQLSQQRASSASSQANIQQTPSTSVSHSHHPRVQTTSRQHTVQEIASSTGGSRNQPREGLAAFQPNRQSTSVPGLNERLRLIYHTWSAAALATGDQHDLESALTSTSLNPLSAVSAVSLPRGNPRLVLPRGASASVGLPVWLQTSLELPGQEEESCSPGPDQTQPPQHLDLACSHRNSATLVKKAGPYILGPRIGSSPVRSVAQCLARKEGTSDFYCMKILTLPEPGQETMDQRQGKMLLLTEFSLLSQLKDMAGVVHCRDFFKDTAWDSRQQRNVRRLCLVVDSLMPHDYDSRSHHLVNLQHHVIQQRRLPEKEALLVFWDIARIVQQLHKINIVHRDLKLGNMVVDRRSWRVTLANFCLGKHLSSETDRLRDQRGSPAYISPDVLSGKPYYGKPSDMWALGVVLFTMLYGQFPFYDCMPQELFRKIKAAEYTIPNDGRVTEDTKLLIRQLLTLDAHQRLTAGQVVDTLEVIIGKWKGMLACETDQVVPSVPVEREPEFELKENDKVTQTEQATSTVCQGEKCGGLAPPSVSASCSVANMNIPGSISSGMSLGGRPLMIKVSTSAARPMSPAEVRAIRHLFTARGGSQQEHR
ncbi:serine/threonine-protein kinase 40 [Plakobranchus ocellatus]|uniref:Serine/threonine-protein kinase 40 n=1 Tax=Plakobranchus ocellatus TaxID=259542 RepID=A0AAV3Y434_9GAST|nr:serine/threonine-protein kinase 40 [Plakobranchus ocellatus]